MASYSRTTFLKVMKRSHNKFVFLMVVMVVLLLICYLYILSWWVTNFDGQTETLDIGDLFIANIYRLIFIFIYKNFSIFYMQKSLRNSIHDIYLSYLFFLHCSRLSTRNNGSKLWDKVHKNINSNFTTN